MGLAFYRQAIYLPYLLCITSAASDFTSDNPRAIGMGNLEVVGEERRYLSTTLVCDHWYVITLVCDFIICL